MGKALFIGNAVLNTSITSFDCIRMVRDRLASRFIYHLQLVRKMHRHRQQPAKRRASTTLADNHRPRPTDHDIAVTSGAVKRGGVQAVNEYGAGNGAGDRAATGRFIGHARSGEAVEEDVGRAGNNRVGAMPWQWAVGRVGDARSGFTTQFKAPCFGGSGCG